MNNHSNKIVKSNEVIGVSVINFEKEVLGEIEEIVLNKESGKKRLV